MSKDTKSKNLDFAKLLGFEAVSDQLSGGVDFKDATFSAKIGAKVGAEPNRPQRAPSIDEPSCGGPDKACCRDCPNRKFLP